MVSLEYIAGIMDGEGTFQCGIGIDPNTIRLRPRAQISFKQSEKEWLLLNDIQKELNLGGVYKVNDGKENALIFWTSKNLHDTITFCETIQPFLHLKQDRCKTLLKISNFIKERRFGNECKKTIDIFSKQETHQIVKESINMNKGRQSDKHRLKTGRTYDYYLTVIDNLYLGSQCNDKPMESLFTR